jgi:Na+-translocating ferredoxin:NAD+ oxidoreductase subunit B
MDPVLIKMAIGGLVLLGCIGLFFGIGLALAAHRFAVQVNPKVEEVLEVLAGAQ